MDKQSGLDAWSQPGEDYRLSIGAKESLIGHLKMASRKELKQIWDQRVLTETMIAAVADDLQLSSKGLFKRLVAERKDPGRSPNFEKQVEEIRKCVVENIRKIKGWKAPTLEEAGIESVYDLPPFCFPVDEFEDAIRAYRGATRSDSNRAERDEFERLRKAAEKLLNVLGRLTPAASFSLMANTGAEAPAIIDDLEEDELNRLLAGVLDTADRLPLRTLEKYLKRLIRAASYCIEDFTQDPKASRRSDKRQLSAMLSDIFNRHYEGVTQGRNSTKQKDAVEFLREGWLAAGIPSSKIPDDERMYRDYYRPKVQSDNKSSE